MALAAPLLRADMQLRNFAHSCLSCKLECAQKKEEKRRRMRRKPSHLFLTLLIRVVVAERLCRVVLGADKHNVSQQSRAAHSSSRANAGRATGAGGAGRPPPSQLPQPLQLTAYPQYGSRLLQHRGCWRRRGQLAVWCSHIF